VDHCTGHTTFTGAGCGQNLWPAQTRGQLKVDTPKTRTQDPQLPSPARVPARFFCRGDPHAGDGGPALQWADSFSYIPGDLRDSVVPSQSGPEGGRGTSVTITAASGSGFLTGATDVRYLRGKRAQGVKRVWIQALTHATKGSRRTSPAGRQAPWHVNG